MIPEIENKPIFFAQITDTLFEVTIPDSSIVHPAAMNITKKPQIKKKSVLNTNPTSAETVVSALPTLVRPRRNTSPNEHVDIVFFNLVIRPPI